MAFPRVYCDVFVLLVIVACVCCKDAGTKVKDNHLPSPMALWRSLLIHHHRWSGYYEHDQTREMCWMFVHSVDTSKDGAARVSFTAEGIHVEMMVLPTDDNKAVTCQEILTWNKTEHFEGHTNLKFQGMFVEDYGYFKLVANVSSKEDDNYGTVTLIPHGRALSDDPSDKSRSRTTSLAMAIAIPMFLGAIVLTLAVFILIWAVRKGYLRRIPWSYRTFRNPKTTRSDVEMDKAGRGEEKGASNHQTDADGGTVALSGVEKTAVHI